MNNRNRIIAILAALPLLTGCGAFNTATESSSEPSTAAVSHANDAADDCCKDSTKDCCTEPADCCGDDAAAALGKPEKTDINIGYLNSTAHLLAFVAAEEGYFKE